jgi:hypothetical protein
MLIKQADMSSSKVANQYLFITVPVQVQFPVTAPVPAPFLDHIKQLSKKSCCKKSCFFHVNSSSIVVS